MPPFSFGKTVTKRIFQTVTWGFKIFFCLIIKKKKIKNQIMNGGIESPLFIDFFEYFREFEKNPGKRIALEIIVFN